MMYNFSHLHMLNNFYRIYSNNYYYLLFKRNIHLGNYFNMNFVLIIMNFDMINILYFLKNNFHNFNHIFDMILYRLKFV